MQDPTARALWLAVTALTATVIGAAAGLIAWAGNKSVADAVLVGGAAFASALLLIITAIRFVTDAKDAKD
jgi:hypothetical protein